MTATLQKWECHPKAEHTLLNLLKDFKKANPFIEQLEEELLQRSSTRLFDWIDHFILNFRAEIERQLEEVGFVIEATTANYRILHHPGAQLPRVVIHDNERTEAGIAVTVDSIADFLMVRGMSGMVEGTEFSAYRRCNIMTENAVALWVVERRCSHTMEPTHQDEHYIRKYLHALEIWQTRPRSLQDQDEAFAITIATASRVVEMLGEDLAAWTFLEIERKYWQARNAAGQVQKNRQDSLGMGWANHDHHTFRSSRRHFGQLIRFFEMLGFKCRERFYAGKEAGWGAQVMEHPNTRLVLFLDVDLLPEELEVDFRHFQLPELDHLSTVGLWCALHGDSILAAGMHHLEAQFMFEQLTEQLATVGVGMMEPFSSFPFLKQAFTKGEIWKVSEERLYLLLNKGLITEEQANKFRDKGAVGSHLENLQRREGYKGFNQKNVSYIIQKTDPRNINF